MYDNDPYRILAPKLAILPDFKQMACLLGMCKWPEKGRELLVYAPVQTDDDGVFNARRVSFLLNKQQ